MKNKKRRLISMLVDCSGSMVNIARVTNEGIADFLKLQDEADIVMALDGGSPWTRVLLADFTSEVVKGSVYVTELAYRVAYGPISLQDAVKAAYTVRPSGGTPLHDAVVRHIHETVEAKKALGDKAPADDSVTVVIFTDGFENDSKDHTPVSVKELVERYTAMGWTFIFMGAEQDAVLTGGAMGIHADRSISYTAAKSGDVLRSVAASVSQSYASGTPVAFTKEQRDEAL